MQCTTLQCNLSMRHSAAASWRLYGVHNCCKLTPRVQHSLHSRIGFQFILHSRFQFDICLLAQNKYVQNHENQCQHSSNPGIRFQFNPSLLLIIRWQNHVDIFFFTKNLSSLSIFLPFWLRVPVELFFWYHWKCWQLCSGKKKTLTIPLPWKKYHYWSLVSAFLTVWHWVLIITTYMLYKNSQCSWFCTYCLCLRKACFNTVAVSLFSFAT